MQMQQAGHQPGTNDQNQPLMMAARDFRKTVRGLAVTQLVIGILTVILSILITIICRLDDVIRPGIWGGVWIGVTGIIGTVSSRHNISNRCATGTYMAFSIVCTFISFICGIPFANTISYYINCDDRFTIFRYCTNTRVTAGLGLFIPSLILMIIEFFVSIIAAVYCCKTINCCCAQRQQGVILAQQQQYQVVATSNQGPTVITTSAGYPPTQAPASYPVASNPPTGYYPPQYSPYPQQQAGFTPAPAQMYPGQQVVSQPPNTGPVYASPHVQTVPADTNMLYSQQPTAPPTYNSVNEKGMY